MRGETNRYGEKIKKATRAEIADELSTWKPKFVLALCTELIFCHHAADWDEIKKRIKEDCENEIQNN